ncbi:MAG: tRNA (5-methylaminomethyl-2-thiouridine)(34)-methyltransferase MnmD [Arachidicoccus sp.]|nr:tRNA (5-methylaminomethyl-2-thiouridine)(34)-methyltransferase MnmD [Arachidicoccus sp.]
MERKLIVTEDGSHTIEIAALHTNYHSIHGAFQESMHVFISAGLEYFLVNNYKSNVHVFEMGFGTGLNALLALKYAMERNIAVYYQSIELFPLEKNEYEKLNYCEMFQNNFKEEFGLLHDCSWEKDISITEKFVLYKSQISLVDVILEHKFDIIFFDAFDPAIQPELWTYDVFKKLYECLNEKGVLVTYSSKGDVRRALIAAGFRIEKISGPKGKREMLRAIKL